GELRVARDHLALTGADARGEEHLPRDQLAIEHGELAVHRHVVEVERRAPVVLVHGRQSARLARDQVEGLVEVADVVLALDTDGERVRQVVRELAADRVMADHVVVHRHAGERIELRAAHLEERLAYDDEDVLPGDRRLLDRPSLHSRDLIGSGEIGGEVALGGLLVHFDHVFVYRCLFRGLVDFDGFVIDGLTRLRKGVACEKNAQCGHHVAMPDGPHYSYRLHNTGFFELSSYLPRFGPRGHQVCKPGCAM